MITLLDNRTLLLVAGGMYVLLPLCTWLVLRMPRQAAPVLWCAGGVLGGVGLVLSGLRGRVDDFLSYVVGQPMLALAVLLVTQSLRHDLGKVWPWRYVWMLTGLYAAALWMLLPGTPAAVLGVMIRGVNLAVVLSLVATAWRVGRAEGSRNATTIAVAYAFQAAGIVFNLVNAWHGSPDIQVNPGSNVSVAVNLLVLMVSLVAAMSYLGLSLERSVRTHIALVQEMTRAEQRQQRRKELVALDRDRMLSVLANSLGHALTQPLTAALVRVQTMQRQMARPTPDLERLKHGVGHVIHEIRRASETVERIRHLVQPLSTRTMAVELQSLLRDVDLLLRQEAINRQITMRFPEPGEPAWIMGDPLQLRHALLQVLLNAMSAITDRQTREVTVTLRRTQQKLIISVSDSGPGLPAAMLQQKQHSGAVAKVDSLQGIGLFVVQSILKAHHAQLLMENDPAGGAVVTLELPRHHPTESPSHASPASGHFTHGTRT